MDQGKEYAQRQRERRLSCMGVPAWVERFEDPQVNDLWKLQLGASVWMVPMAGRHVDCPAEWWDASEESLSDRDAYWVRVRPFAFPEPACVPAENGWRLWTWWEGEDHEMRFDLDGKRLGELYWPRMDTPTQHFTSCKDSFVAILQSIVRFYLVTGKCQLSVAEPGLGDLCNGYRI